MLDTNIITALFDGESNIVSKIDNANEIFIPITVVGELYYGAYYSKQIEKNIANIRNLLSEDKKINPTI